MKQSFKKLPLEEHVHPVTSNFFLNNEYNTNQLETDFSMTGSV